MKKFNKYQFTRELEEEIITELKNGNIEKDEEEIREYIHQHIDNECIYYCRCWEICSELNQHNFETEFGKANNISELAFYSLLELSYEINIEEILTQLEEE
jgi:hypothetical protein